jgi:hypothetical protein
MLFALTFLAATPTQHILESLESKKAFFVEETFLGDALTTISRASVYEASLGFDITDSYGNIKTIKYVLNDKGTLTFFDTEYQLFSSDQFLATIRDDFYLNDIDDGLLFQEFLYAVDESYFNEGFYIDDHSWIFVRDEFFGDLEVWIAKTDEMGKITSLSYDYDADITMSEERYFTEDNNFRYDEYESPLISDSVAAQIESELEKSFVYEIEIAPISSNYLDKVTKAKWYNCEISIIEEYEDGSSSSIYDLLVMDNNTEVTFSQDNVELITSPSFLNSLREDFYLTDDESAENFELVLDQLSDYDRMEKARFERNGGWVFIRDEFFDDGRGFLVDTDDMGNITFIEYSWEVPLEGVEVPIEVPFDESEVTWNFILIEPQTRDIHISDTESIPVTIEFNEWASNQLGAWIGTFQDGEMVGFYAGSDITSPFTDLIPGEYLNYGKNIIAYRLLRPSEDYEDSIATIELTVWVDE